MPGRESPGAVPSLEPTKRGAVFGRCEHHDHERRTAQQGGEAPTASSSSSDPAARRSRGLRLTLSETEFQDHAEKTPAGRESRQGPRSRSKKTPGQDRATRSRFQTPVGDRPRPKPNRIRRERRPLKRWTLSKAGSYTFLLALSTGHRRLGDGSGHWPSAARGRGPSSGGGLGAGGLPLERPVLPRAAAASYPRLPRSHLVVPRRPSTTSPSGGAPAY